VEIHSESIGTTLVRRSSVPHSEQLQEAIEEIIRALPPCPMPAQLFALSFRVSFKPI